MAQGIILAAGYASRAKTNKMLLMANGKPLIEHAIDGMQPYVSHIFVVTGHYHHEISEFLEEKPFVTCIENKDYPSGMFSSVKKGVEAVSEDFFVLPGDCPFIGPGTYELLLKGHKPIRIPSYQGRKGHPLFILISLKGKLLKEVNESNLRVFRDRQDAEVIETNDPEILTDIDTIENFVYTIDRLGKE
ncbi:MAG TPA: molybdopterin-guanine dinucleotide biosynthesis protein A [Acholeplasmatales bacterium]|nr:molybdopterin-guanine dinucleotide biosynthesis protein A [Acholeplasmatales bacterium]